MPTIASTALLSPLSLYNKYRNINKVSLAKYFAQFKFWVITVSLSGIKEKLRITFEAARAHRCLSTHPSSSRLNNPSSSYH
jgi:hypothetical protein